VRRSTTSISCAPVILAMERAIAGLFPRPPDHVLVDAPVPFGLTLPAQAIIKGDALCLSIAARFESGGEKITRDAIMWDLAQQFPLLAGRQNLQDNPSKKSTG